MHDKKPETFRALRDIELRRKYPIPREGKRNRWLTLDEIIHQYLALKQAEGCKKALRVAARVKQLKRKQYWSSFTDHLDPGDDFKKIVGGAINVGRRV